MSAPTSPTLPSVPAIRAALMLDPDSAFWYGRTYEVEPLGSLRTLAESKVSAARDTIHCIAEQIDLATKLPALIEAVEELLLTAPYAVSQPIYALMREVVPPTVVVPTLANRSAPRL